MNFVEVKEVPRKTFNMDLANRLEEFMKLNIKVAKVDFSKNEYKNVTSAQGSFKQAITRKCLPITATVRNGELYLIRNDM